MKHLAFMLGLTLILILTIGTAAFANITLKIGYDTNGFHEYQGTNEDVEPATSIAVELIKPVTENDRIEWGAGIEYQTPRALEDGASDATFQFTSVYGLINYYAQPNGTSLYFTTRIGFTFFEASNSYKNGSHTKGNYCYGVGGGISFSRKTQLELLYAVNSGDLADSTVTSTRTNLSFGFRF